MTNTSRLSESAFAREVRIRDQMVYVAVAAVVVLPTTLTLSAVASVVNGDSRGVATALCALVVIGLTLYPQRAQMARWFRAKEFYPAERSVLSGWSVRRGGVPVEGLHNIGFRIDSLDHVHPGTVYEDCVFDLALISRPKGIALRALRLIDCTIIVPERPVSLDGCEIDGLRIELARHGDVAEVEMCETTARAVRSQHGVFLSLGKGATLTESTVGALTLSHPSAVATSVRCFDAKVSSGTMRGVSAQVITGMSYSLSLRDCYATAIQLRWPDAIKARQQGCSWVGLVTDTLPPNLTPPAGGTIILREQSSDRLSEESKTYIAPVVRTDKLQMTLVAQASVVHRHLLLRTSGEAVSPLNIEAFAWLAGEGALVTKMPDDATIDLALTLHRNP